MVDEHKTRDAFGCSSGRARSRAFGPDNCCDSADDSTRLALTLTLTQPSPSI